MQFVVASVSVKPNVRGQSMRRVVLQALPGEAFQSTEDLPAGVTAPDPEGVVDLLLNEEEAKRFAVGDVFDASFRERG